MIPANLLGLFASVIGMLMGSLAPSIVAHRGHSIQHVLTHHAHDAHQGAVGTAGPGKHGR